MVLYLRPFALLPSCDVFVCKCQTNFVFFHETFLHVKALILSNDYQHLEWLHADVIAIPLYFHVSSFSLLDSPSALHIRHL